MYRAWISVPVNEDNVDEAFDRAVELAHSLHEDGAVIGHLEALTRATRSPLAIPPVVERQYEYVTPEWRAAVCR